MYKLIHDINTSCRCCVVVVLMLCASAGAFAQDVDSTEGIYDSETLPEVTTTTTEQVKQFDPVTDAHKTTIEHRKVSERSLKKIKEEEDFWYVNEAPPRRAKEKPVSEPRPSKVINATWFRNLLWILVVGGFIAILIWFLLSSNVQLFQRKQTKIVQEDELSTDNIFDINYEMEIAKAAAAKDFRLAIRLLYLQILKELSQKGILHYKQERTNSDYVLQLFGTAYYKDFFALTRSFEYSWYGQFPISEEAFKTIHTHFSTFKQGLP